MALTITVNNNFKFQLMGGNIDFDADTFKLVLMTGQYTFDADADDSYSLISGQEVQNGGYTVGGITLTGGSLTKDLVNNRGQMAWSNPSLTAVGTLGPTRGAIVFDDTATADPVVGFADFGEAITVSDGSVLQFQSIVVRLS